MSDERGIERPKPTIVQPPDGHAGSGFFATKVDEAIGLARKNSLWPLPFATSCCGIEFMSTMSSHYDLSRFGMERLSFSPRQSDLLMVMGTIAKKMAPVLREVYMQMAEPKWAPDAFELNFENFVTYAEKGALADLTPLIAADTGFSTSVYNPTALAAFAQDGKQYGTPEGHQGKTPWVR